MKRGALLFEVALAVFLVSIISLFLFRGYSVFTKAAKKKETYLKLVSLSQEKFCDLQIKEKSAELSEDIERQGSLDSYQWQLDLADEGKITVILSDREASLDTIAFFNFQEE